MSIMWEPTECLGIQILTIKLLLVISIVFGFFGTPCICIKKTQPRNFLRNTLQFLSIKDFRPLGIEIELLIDHTVCPKKKATL